MKSLPTVELFEEVINKRGVYNELELPPNRVLQIRNNFKQGKVSIDYMHDILKLAGYQITQEERWGKAPSKEDKQRYRAIREEMAAFGYDLKKLTDHQLETLIQFIDITSSSPNQLREFLIRVKSI